MGVVPNLDSYALNAITGIGDTTGLFFPLVGHALGAYKIGRVESDAIQGTYNAFFKDAPGYGFGTYVGYRTGIVAANALIGEPGTRGRPPGRCQQRGLDGVHRDVLSETCRGLAVLSGVPAPG